jgi:hypothetical protein
MSLLSKLGLFRNVIRKHTNWVLYSLFGREAISDEAYEELKKFNKLPMDNDVSLVEKSYLLGRLKSSLKSSEYKKITSRELSNQLSKAKFTTLEELVIQEAKFSAADNVKGLMDDIAAGVFAGLSDAIGQRVSEATVKEIIREEVVAALSRGDGHKDLAAGLSERLQDKYSRDWQRVAYTELHAAKTKGFAQAIVNKLGVFSGSDGIDSKVSVVPNAGACSDCKSHYLDSTGNPKVFTLRSLMSAGTNADPSISHARDRKGLHKHWKTTLPPLHPRCFCQVVYMPAGFAWKAGRLAIVDKDAHESGVSSMRKALRDVATLSKANGVGNPVKVGQTAAATKAQKQLSQPGNIPGVAAPSQVGAGGASSSPESPAGAGDGNSKCIAGGGQQCVAAGGGDGADSHETGGKQQQLHMAYYAKNPSAPRDKEAFGEYEGVLKEKSESWASVPRTVAENLNFLSLNDIVFSDKVHTPTGDSKGLEQLYFKDGGLAYARLPLSESDWYSTKLEAATISRKGTTEGFLSTGLRTTPHDQSHNHEVAAYELSKLLCGDQDDSQLVPPTTYREVSHPDGPKTVSVQNYSKLYDTDVNVAEHEGLIDSATDKIKELTKRVKAGYAADASSEDQAFSEKYRNAAITSLVMGDADKHWSNVIFNKDFTDFRLIDHESAFSNSFDESKNDFVRALASTGVELHIPPALQSRLASFSLSNYERALGSHLQDWQVGQTYLRGQYLLHLQEQEGHIDPDKFIFDSKPQGSDEFDYEKGWRHTDDAEDRHKLWMDPRSLFENFVLNWLDEHTSSKRDPLYEDALRLKKQNVFMPRSAFFRDEGSSFSADHKSSRKAGAHDEYLKKLTESKDRYLAVSTVDGARYSVPPDLDFRKQALTKLSQGTLGEFLTDATEGAESAVRTVHQELEQNPQMSADALHVHKKTATMAQNRLIEALSFVPPNGKDARNISKQLGMAKGAARLIKERLRGAVGSKNRTAVGNAKLAHTLARRLARRGQSAPRQTVKEGAKNPTTQTALLNAKLAETKETVSSLDPGTDEHKKAKRDVARIKTQLRSTSATPEAQTTSKPKPKRRARRADTGPTLSARIKEAASKPEKREAVKNYMSQPQAKKELLALRSEIGNAPGVARAAMYRDFAFMAEPTQELSAPTPTQGSTQLQGDEEAVQVQATPRSLVRVSGVMSEGTQDLSPPTPTEPPKAKKRISQRDRRAAKAERLKAIEAKKKKAIDMYSKTPTGPTTAPRKKPKTGRPRKAVQPKQEPKKKKVAGEPPKLSGLYKQTM